MALQMRQDLRMSQQMVITPQLQQAIKLLQLSRIELTELVRDELLENPLLEESQEMEASSEEQVSAIEMRESVENLRDASDAYEGDTNLEIKVDQAPKDNFDWQTYLENSAYLPPVEAGGRRHDELPTVEATLSRPETLTEYLLWQIRLSDFSPFEEEAAEYIIRCLSSNGYLRELSVPQLARNLDTSPLRIEKILRKIQQLDPLAVASRSLEECLWVQVHHPEHPIEDPLVLGMICKHLGNLESRKYTAIARDLGETVEEVCEAMKVITELEPRPARAYAGETSPYIIPDVYISKVDDEFVVSTNDDGLPKLQISRAYRMDGDEDEKTRDYIQDRLRSAQWLIRAIQQRQKTILRVTQSVLKFQREFFEKGVQYLRPLILRDVADDIEMHESTISRVTTNKYVHTPQGIFELKFFFNAGFGRDHSQDFAAEAIKIKIKNLIDHEQPSQPYSDQKLVECLQEEGIDIARRTVAKYREQLGFLPSSKRRQMF